MSKLLIALALVFSCKVEPPATSNAPKNLAVDRPAGPRLDKVDRDTFNRLAAELMLPLYWTQDAGEDGAISPAELTTLWRIADTRKTDWVSEGVFTGKFMTTYDAIVARSEKGLEPTGNADEDKRRALVQQELAQSRQTLIYNDFSKATPEEKKIGRAHV